MNTYQLTEETFLKDVDQHVMEVIHEDGVFRHLRFKQPGTVCMHFDLITWPGRLCYTGDMGTFVFSRIHDMLEFFRPDAYAIAAPFKRIDRNYWAEKVDASGRDGITGARSRGHIGFAAIRGGDIVGEHDVRFGAEREVLTLSHEALDRGLFADGALAAALWAADKPAGLYSMRDVLGI